MLQFWVLILVILQAWGRFCFGMFHKGFLAVCHCFVTTRTLRSAWPRFVVLLLLCRIGEATNPGPQNECGFVLGALNPSGLPGKAPYVVSHRTLAMGIFGPFQKPIFAVAHYRPSGPVCILHKAPIVIASVDTLFQPRRVVNTMLLGRELQFYPNTPRGQYPIVGPVHYDPRCLGEWGYSLW